MQWEIVGAGGLAWRCPACNEYNVDYEWMRKQQCAACQHAIHVRVVVADEGAWDKAGWAFHVLANSENSYSLAACAAALFLAEFYADDEAAWDEALRENINGLTGFQSGAAKQMAREIKGWARRVG